MSEERRLVNYSHTRENFDVALMTNDETCYLVALTADQIEIVRRAIQYAHRRINWVDEQVDVTSYYLPDDETWDAVESVVDDMEDCLMGGCDVSLLIDAITGLCTCMSGTIADANAQQLGPASGTLMTLAMSDGNIDALGPIMTVEADVDACRAAQTWWAMAYEFWTEVSKPVAETYDEIFTMLYSFMNLVGGGVVQWLISLGVTYTFLRSTWGVYFANTSANLINYMFTAKQELICAAYRGFAQDPPNFDELEAVIDASGESASVIFVLHGMRQAFLPIAQLCKDTAWALARQEEGYCDECVQPGCFDFCDEDWVVTEESGYAIVDGCVLKMVEPPVGLQEMAGRTWTLAGSSFDVAFSGKGALNEEHNPFTMSFDFQDDTHATVGSTAFTTTVLTDDDFLWSDLAVSAPLATHCHVSVKGVTMTAGWVYWVCVVVAS